MASVLALLAGIAAGMPTLQPAGKWVVDYRPDMCIAGRDFGTAPATTTFALQPALDMDEDTASLLVLTPERLFSGYREGTATLTLQPSGEVRKLDYRSWVAPTGKQRVFKLELDADFMKSLKRSTGLTLQTNAYAANFATGKMEAIARAMAVCNDSLLRSWNIDPTLKARLADGIDPGKWFNDSMYPPNAKALGAQGRVVIAVTVGPDGKPSACRVVISSKSNDLDRSSCSNTMARARYLPDRDTPNRYAILAISWVLSAY